MAISIESKVLTDNPLLDEIIYNCRQLCTETVLKDQEDADLNETIESAQNGDLLIAIAQGRANFNRFKYTKELLLTVPGISAYDAEIWSADNSLIPEDIRDACLKIAENVFIQNYIEYNDYYRMLHGEPDYDPSGEWKGLYVDTTTLDRVLKKQMPDISVTKDTSNHQLIHELDIGYLEPMYDNGIMRDIINNEHFLALNGLSKSDVRYLLYTGVRSISYYEARVANRFDLLYCPESDVTDLTRRYKELIDLNKIQVLSTIYSEAYKFQSPYYDRFMMIMIVIQSIIDMLIEMQEYIMRRDVFDMRTCAYIFESAGVEFFPDIPLKYQVALVKNLNKIIKFKSTDKCMVDICSVFGCKNIEIFRYYILKDRSVDDPISGKQNYLNHKKKEVINSDTGETEEVPDDDKNYDLKFVKVPIMKSYDDYIRQGSHIVSYDEMTRGDAYWVGDKVPEEVKKEIKDMDFTLLRSKYYSTEAVIDMAKRSFTMVYFMNILMYNKIDKTKLEVLLSNINTKQKFQLTDVIITLFALGYTYYGVEDAIMDTQSKVLSIMGFNFEADLQKIQEYLAEKYPYDTVDWDELKISGFKIPENSRILSFPQLMEIYTTNKAIYDHVTHEIANPKSRDLYYAYRYIYDSLFVMKLHMDYFKLPSGDIAPTYSEYLKYKSPELYAYIMDIKNIVSFEKRQTACVNAIQSIITYLKDYIDNNIVDVDELFAGLPSISMEFIVSYINEVINFFKSFKIYMKNTSILYLFNDKFENSIPVIDWMLMTLVFHKSETSYFNEIINNMRIYKTLTDDKEKSWIIDKIYMSVYSYITKNFKDYYDTRYMANGEQLSSSIHTMIHSVISSFEFYEDMEDCIREEFKMYLTSLGMKDNMIIKDSMIWSFILNKEEWIIDQINDLFKSIISTLNPYDIGSPMDNINFKSIISGSSSARSKYLDRINNFKIDMNLKDRDVFMRDDCYLIRTNSQ